MARASLQTQKTFKLSNVRRKQKSKYKNLFRLLSLVSFLLVSMYLVAAYQFSKSAFNGDAADLIIHPKRKDSNDLLGKGVDTKLSPVTISRASTPSKILPKWIEDYISWHQDMRSKFPGKAIIEDPNAPPVLVRTCLGLCGGLHDRIGQLPLDLYLANQTQRILLIKWIKPQPLEEFLVPPTDGLDWVFPLGVEGWGTGCRTLNLCAKQVRAQPSIRGNQGGDRGEVTIEQLLTDGIRDLNGKMKDSKAVTFGIMAHLSEETLERRLKALGETDMIHHTASFGNIFRKFFQPHPNVQKEIDQVFQQYGLVSNEYTIAHCRVRHPKAYNPGEKFNGQFIANADKLGLPFEGRFQELAVGIAQRAINCAVTLPDVINHPIYFMGDESKMVSYLTRDLFNKSFIQGHPDWFSDKRGYNATAKETFSKYNVVARDQDIPNAHIDKNKGRKPPEYYATFVDLYLGMNARCVSFGIGKYAMFAAKLSGTNCKIRYATEKWGEQAENFERENDRVQMCALSEDTA